MPPASARNRGTRTSGIAGSPPWPASPPRGGRPAGKPPVSRVSQDRGMRPKEARYHRGGVGDAFSRIRPEHGSVEPPSSGEGAMIEVSRPPTANRPSPGGAFRPPSAAPAPTATPVATSQPRLLDQMREALRSRHYSRRTEQSYCHWVKRFVLFHGARHPSEMAEPQINAFLTYLAVKESVSASTQNQALSALLFLSRRVIGREVGDLGDLIRARRPLRVPVVMARDEVKVVLAQMSGDRWLMASLMYSAGLRLTECLCLRVQDIDFARKEITVRAGKGNKDRRTMLPESLKQPLEQHLRAVKRVHEKDLADGWGRVLMPDALDRKYPGAPTDWRWQWAFPQVNRWRNAQTGEQSRHHIDEALVQRAVRDAVARAGLTKQASCHTFRHSFATPLARSWLRHPDGAGAAGPQRREDHHDLHPRPQPRPGGRA